MTRRGDGPGEWIAQQVFARLIEGRNDRPEAEQNYLKRAVRNQCFSILRSRRRDRLAIDCQPLWDAVPADNDRIDERLTIERALRELPPEQAFSRRGQTLSTPHAISAFRFRPAPNANHRPTIDDRRWTMRI